VSRWDRLGTMKKILGGCITLLTWLALPILALAQVTGSGVSSTTGGVTGSVVAPGTLSSPGGSGTAAGTPSGIAGTGVVPSPGSTAPTGVSGIGTTPGTASSAIGTVGSSSPAGSPVA
jgi:hypothetical protein